MPAWLATALVRFVLPLLIQWAVKHNLISELTGALAKFGLELKTYSDPSDFPTGKNGEFKPATPTPNNIQPQKVQ